MKSRLPKSSSKSGAPRREDALSFPSVQAYPTEHATSPADHLDAAPVLQRYAQNGGVVQLKGWKWVKGTSQWEEVDVKEPGSHVKPSIRGDVDGEVLDTNTGAYYRNVAEYLHFTAPLVNPKFVGAKQTLEEQLEMRKVREEDLDPMHGAAAKLNSFLKGGVMLPSQIGGSVTTSADEKDRPDQISVNKFGPFASDEDAALHGTYAALNPANGAIPVVLENSADVIRPQEEPDPHALAQRAHNSALAIIDPSKLGPEAHLAIKQIKGGEMTLRSGIPSSCFVAVLMPINMYPLVTEAEIQRYNIQFVGSVSAKVSYNFRPQGGQKSSKDVKTSVPDYERALTEIFKANKESIFLTHIIRMSPKAAIPVTSTASASAAQESGAAVASALAANPAPSAQESAAVAASAAVAQAPAAQQVAPPPAALSVDQIAEAVVNTYKATFNVDDAKITDANTLLAMHAAQGVTDANKDAVFAALQDYVDLR